MKKGGVELQTLAVFTETKKGSRRNAEHQLQLYRETLLPEKEAPQFALAIENGSSLLEQGESIDLLSSRLDEERWLYISLTWKEENRFGGGDQTTVGLKEDGRILLELMSERNIPIDLSHTSDRLAEEILNTLHKKNLPLIPVASHSNFRSIKKVPRNLPDEFAKEIIAFGGVIGINFVRHFVGDKPEDFLKHVRHGLSLGGENALALGADFFGGLSAPKLEHLKPFFFPALPNSSCYPDFLSLLSSEFSTEQVEKIAYKNGSEFLKKITD